MEKCTNCGATWNLVGISSEGFFIDDNGEIENCPKCIIIEVEDIGLTTKNTNIPHIPEDFNPATLFES